MTARQRDALRIAWVLNSPKGLLGDRLQRHLGLLESRQDRVESYLAELCRRAPAHARQVLAGLEALPPLAPVSAPYAAQVAFQDLVWHRRFAEARQLLAGSRALRSRPGLLAVLERQLEDAMGIAATGREGTGPRPSGPVGS